MSHHHGFDREKIVSSPQTLASVSSAVYLVGIDDTDNLHGPGTGFHARRLGSLLQSEEIASLLEITRHQLFFDRRIPYTSHNSSLCMRIRIEAEQRVRLIETCRTYLMEQSAKGSDAGLCIGAWVDVTPAMQEFGAKAKRDVVTKDMARELAGHEPFYLEGLTGDHGGIIGAVAAIGLRRSDKDGRIAWRPGIRETTGIVTVGELIASTGIDAVRRVDNGAAISAEERIDVRPWPRAVMIDGQAVLLVQKAGSYHDHFNWQLASKSILHAY